MRADTERWPGGDLLERNTSTTRSLFRRAALLTPVDSVGSGRLLEPPAADTDGGLVR
jgi:hypothetical protein